jgi:hypothetical protein
MQDDGIDDLLALAARDRPTPSAALIDRVLADAAQVQPVAPARPARRPGPGLLARLAAAFGGGPVLAGVCSSVVLGMAVGYLNPTSLDYLTGGLIAAETVDLFPSVDALLTEG